MAESSKTPVTLKTFDIWLNWERFNYAAKNQKLSNVLSFSGLFPLRKQVLKEYNSVCGDKSLVSLAFGINGEIISTEYLEYMTHHYFVVKYILEYRQEWIVNCLGYIPENREDLIVSLEAVVRTNLGDPIEFMDLPVFRAKDDPYHWLI